MTLLLVAQLAERTQIDLCFERRPGKKTGRIELVGARIFAVLAPTCSRLKWRILPIVLAVLFGACNDGRSTASAASSVTTTDWTIAYSHNVPPRMIEEQGGDAHYFNFPNSDGVHYIIQQAPAVRAGQTVTLRFAIVGDGKLVPTEGEPPARIRLFLQQRGDRMTAAEEFKRWWSVASVELVAGEFVLKADLVPTQWSSVFGKNGAQMPEAFRAAITDLEHVGFTFGGMFAGHGVFVIGEARFVLTQFSIK
jgi:hypothetical protein